MPCVEKKPTFSHNPEHTMSRVKHGGGRMLLWGCFSSIRNRELIV